MKKFYMLGLLIFTLSSIGAHAADSSSGCGPGWYILKDNSLVSSSLRATTHGVLLPVVTIGMTVGTSNCTQHKIVATEKESLHFATMNYFELKTDMAKGGGEHLAAFAQTIGCNSATQSQFNGKMKSNFQTVAPQNEINPEKMLSEVYRVILTNSDLTRSCSLG